MWKDWMSYQISFFMSSINNIGFLNMRSMIFSVQDVQYLNFNTQVYLSIINKK